MSESGMTKNQELDQWCKRKWGRMYKLSKKLGVSRQYLSALRKLDAGISDAKWKVIKSAMDGIA